MKEIPVKRYIRLLFGILLFVFILNKFCIRPWILEYDIFGFIRIITFSIPNFIEAVIGTFLLTGILFQVRSYFQWDAVVKDVFIYPAAVSAAGVYVISQELNYHTLGGKNVYDSYDLAASVIGLTVAFGVIQAFGFADLEEVNDLI